MPCGRYARRDPPRSIRKERPHPRSRRYCAGYDAEESVLTCPVLLIEILSTSNQAETWANVWAYTSVPSVPEFSSLRGLRHILWSCD
jgi:hypothetical protein